MFVHSELIDELKQLKLSKSLANNLKIEDHMTVRNLLYRHAHTKFVETKEKLMAERIVAYKTDDWERYYTLL